MTGAERPVGVEIRVEHLTKRFGRQTIWEDVSLTLPAGEISVLLGPSGTGKSVFLKTLIGLLKPENGSIVINGHDITKVVNLDSVSAATVDRDVARVVQGATGTFKEQFDRAKDELKSLVVARKTVSKGTILSAGVVRADRESATLLVAADRLVKDTTAPEGQLAHDRWKVEMEKHDGHWLVAELEPVG